MESNKSFIETLLSSSANKASVFCRPVYWEEEVLPLVCGLLNTDGGWVVVGVTEKHEMADEDMRGMRDRIQTEIVRHISPLPLVYVTEEEMGGKTVVLISVIKGVLSPYTYRGKCYVIINGDAAVPSVNEMNWLLRNERGAKVTWELSPCLMTEREDLDWEQIQKVIVHGLANKRLREDLAEPDRFISHLGFRQNQSYAQGCVAMFGTHAERQLPQCKVRIQVMLKGKGGDMYDDTVSLYGNAFVVQKAISEYFAKRLPMLSYFSEQEWDRKDALLYPSDVIDEAVTNAIIHRDYSDTAGEITIFIYKDKLSITNSGQIPESVLSGKNKIRPHQSMPRNSQMAEVFFVDGKMERTGRGLGLIVDRMKEKGARLPEWTSKDGYTTLTIYSNAEAVKLNNRIRAYLSERALGFEFSKQDYLVANEAISKITAQTDIQIMTSLGLCEKIGNGPKSRYVYVKKLTDIDR